MDRGRSDSNWFTNATIILWTVWVRYILANLSRRLIWIAEPGMYAPHTGGGNTGSIGVSMCAMANFEYKTNQGHFPITKIQFESTMKLCAELADKYQIKVSPETVMTCNLGKNTSKHYKLWQNRYSLFATVSLGWKGGCWEFLSGLKLGGTF